MDPRQWPATRRHGWPVRERRGLGVLCAAALLFLIVLLIQRPTTLSDPPPPVAPLQAELLDRLDPNVATAAQLAALPGIGPSKAEAIVTHRTSVNGRAFHHPDDLADVHGIGPAIVGKLRPHVMFPVEPSVDEKSGS
jgi:competence protein ComEA